MTLTAYSTAIALRGASEIPRRFAVVDPAQGVHVYAPGVSGYKPIALRIVAQPGVLVREAHVPPAEDYYFTPLDEHVRAYQKPFRLLQDVTIDPSPEGARALAGHDRLTLSGTLEYQACNDQVCFTPQSIPLSWNVQVKPLDRERVRKP